jgi:hypothetical protein
MRWKWYLQRDGGIYVVGPAIGQRAQRGAYGCVYQWPRRQANSRSGREGTARHRVQQGRVR